MEPQKFSPATMFSTRAGLPVLVDGEPLVDAAGELLEQAPAMTATEANSAAATVLRCPEIMGTDLR